MILAGFSLIQCSVAGLIRNALLAEMPCGRRCGLASGRRGLSRRVAAVGTEVPCPGRGKCVMSPVLRLRVGIDFVESNPAPPLNRRVSPQIPRTSGDLRGVHLWRQGRAKSPGPDFGRGDRASNLQRVTVAFAVSHKDSKSLHELETYEYIASSTVASPLTHYILRNEWGTGRRNLLVGACRFEHFREGQS